MNNKKKSDETMEKEEKTEETEVKKEIKTDVKGVIDGQEVNTPAEGDDYEAGDKVKGDPYNETEHYSKKDMEDMIKQITTDVIKNALDGKLSAFEEKLNKDLAPIKEKQKIEAENEKKDLVSLLQKDPYKLSVDTIKDLTLEELKTKKDTFDQLPMIQDFFKENQHITHEQVNKYAFDMQSPEDRIDSRTAIFQKAQKTFITHDLGEEKYKQDFGGMYE